MQKQRVLRIRKNLAEFFHTVARFAVRSHRYQEAIELEKKAVAADPHYYAAMQEIGTGYLRLGEEKKGLSWLQKAWQGDQYNVRTFNILELFDKVIPQQYSFQRTKTFRIRYPNRDKKVLSRYVEPLLHAAYTDMVKRYRYRPELPITVELYGEHDHYSVRTVGVPNLGALGICFGKVVTTLSPSVGSVNWAMVLWHELSHVFAIQLSNYRVARWYTEGLSEYETILARPEWRRENNFDVWVALMEGTLPSVAELNHDFIHPDPQRVVVAYHVSSLAIEFIAKRYGFKKVLEGLSLYGRNLETPAVIQKIAAVSVDEFDAQFRAYLKKRLAVYDRSFYVPTNLPDLSMLKKRASMHPADLNAQARLALAYFFDGNAEAARKQSEKALTLDARDKIALYVGAELAFRERNWSKAFGFYNRLIAAGADNADIRSRLGMLAVQAGNIKGAETAFRAAKRLDPERSFPYYQLYELYKKQSQAQRAMAELEGYVAIEQMEYAPVKELVLWNAKQQYWDKVRHFGQLAIHVNPLDPDLLIAVGDAYAPVDAKRSVFSYQSALASKHLRRPALAHIGLARVHLQNNRRGKARREIRKALRYEPNNWTALRLHKKMQ